MAVVPRMLRLRHILRTHESAAIVGERVDGEWTMKYFTRTKGGAVVLESANPKYDPAEIPALLAAFGGAVPPGPGIRGRRGRIGDLVGHEHGDGRRRGLRCRSLRMRD